MEVLKVNRKPYSSAIKKTPFKYPITKKIAKLMLDGLDREEVYTECFNNNQIEIESKDRRREVTNVVYSRLTALDEFLLSQFYNADVSTSKFILAYAIAKTDSWARVWTADGGAMFLTGFMIRTAAASPSSFRKADAAISA